jgi:flagellin
LLGKSQERLSTGLRVNSALDNPTNFFTAQGLNSRANDLSQLSDAVANAVQTVAAADKGITAITKLVESAQATARQALQTAATVASTGAASATGTTAIASDTTATLTGTAGGYVAGTNTSYAAFGDASTLTLDIGGTQVDIQFYNSSVGATGHTSYAGPGIGIDTDDGGTQKTIGDTLAEIQAGLRASGYRRHR